MYVIGSAAVVQLWAGFYVHALCACRHAACVCV